MIFLLLFQTVVHLGAICAMYAASRDRKWGDWGLNFVFAASVAIGLRRITLMLAETTPELTDAVDVLVPLVVSVLFLAAGIAFYSQGKEQANGKHLRLH